MNKPNIDIPSGFAKNGTKEDFPNDKILNGFDPINPDILPGDCLNKFIDDTYKGLNYALSLGDYVSGNSQTTNCILEAPNGVLTYNSDTKTFTMPSGLRGLVCHGFNPDGTLLNLERNFINSLSYVNNITSKSSLYIAVVENAMFVFEKSIFKTVQTYSELPSPATGKYYKIYVVDDNKIYSSDDGASFVEQALLILGEFDTDSAGNVISWKAYRPVQLTNYADFNALNTSALRKNQITNCILEAPNGTPTINGQFLTVKAGTKCLIPNGRNDDGTLNNIEYILPNDYIMDKTTWTVGNNAIEYIFIKIDGTIVTRNTSETFWQVNQPQMLQTTQAKWYNPETNFWYNTTDQGQTWQIEHICPVCITPFDQSGFISVQPMNTSILKYSDKMLITNLNSPASRYIDLTLGVFDSEYTMVADGYLLIQKRVVESDNPKYISIHNLTTEIREERNGIGGNNLSILQRVSKGDRIRIAYSLTGVTETFRFIYCKGAIY